MNFLNRFQILDFRNQKGILPIFHRILIWLYQILHWCRYVNMTEVTARQKWDSIKFHVEIERIQIPGKCHMTVRWQHLEVVPRILCVLCSGLFGTIFRDRIYDPDFYSTPGFIINRFWHFKLASFSFLWNGGKLLIFICKHYRYAWWIILNSSRNLNVWLETAETWI